MGDRAERNLMLYPAYAAVFSAHFWLPVFFLYFQSHFTLADVLRLEAIYYFSVVLLEVPSGYFSDVVGRRITLIIAAASTAAAHALFCFSDDFALFAVAQALLATGIAFNSGTDTSLHHDTLAGLGRAEEYGAREARVAHWAFRGSGLAALLGGLAATVDLRYAYALSLLGALAALALVFGMVEPIAPDRERGISLRGFAIQVLQALKGLRQPALCWLSGYVVLMVVLNHLPYEFYQPYLKALLGTRGFETAVTPALSGAVTLATMLIAGQVAGRSIWLRDRIGLGPTLLVGTALQAAIITAMAFFIHPVLVGLILLRSCPRALMTAPRNAAIAPLIQPRHRATYLSLESLAGRLAFAGVLWGLSTLGTTDGAGLGLGPVLQGATAIAAVALLVLIATVGLLNKKPPRQP